ncbi:MAG: DUF2142 domain-containing protein [Sphingobacteriaceae bacterium]
MHLLQKIKPQYFFIVAALFFQWQFDRVTPPLQSSDEFNHFYRALQIAEGQWLPLKQDDRLGGYVPESVRKFVIPYNNAALNLKYVLKDEEIDESSKIKYSPRDSLFYDYPNTALYSVVSYLPHAVVINVLKRFDVTVATLYYGARYFTFLIWLIAMFFVIKMMPFGKWLTTLLLLLPMHVFITNSFSADTATNIIALLFISYTLKLAYQEKHISYLNLALLLSLIVLLAFAKVVYIGLVVLLIVIPKKQFNNKWQHFFGIGILLMAALTITYFWSNKVLEYYTPYSNYNSKFKDGICLSNCANYYLQKDYIIHHKMYFLNVVYHSIIDHPITYFNGYVGLFGNMDIFISKKLIYLTYIIILFVALFERNDRVPTILMRITFVVAALGAFILLLLSQHLTWDCVGEGVVDLVQGRYLIPILPLLFFVLVNRYNKIKYIPTGTVVILVFVLHHFSAKAVHDRFFVESYDRKIEFFCDSENVNENWSYVTTNDSLIVEGGKFRRDTLSHSGKYSAYLDFWIRYNFICKLKNIAYGDLIEITGWQKGKTGSFVLSGEGTGCAPFFYASNKIQYEDEKGWGYMNYVFTYTNKCDSNNAVFFVWNPDTTRMVRFDDVKFSIKKYNKNYLDSALYVK